jgi:purine-binding chemotaxis protein CheW
MNDLSVTDYLETDALTNGAQWLTFVLDGQEYGVDIQRVQEIKTWTQTTSLPNSPSHIRGVINIRGAIVPIVDLRKRFSLEEIPYTKTTVVLVLTVERDDKERIVGVVVDAVSDVCDANEDQLRPAPDIGVAGDTQFIQGIMTINDQMVIILDVDRLLNTQSDQFADIDVEQVLVGVGVETDEDAPSDVN